MYKYVEIFNFNVPVYSICVYGGLLITNIIAVCFLQINKLNKRPFLKIELIGGISAIFGAKFISFLEKYIGFLLGYNDFIPIKEVGCAYYGGLFAFYLSVFLYNKYSKKNLEIYTRKMIFLLPLLHVFWKIGCFCAGCCVGGLYDGILSVVYPTGVNELSGLGCCPVQIFEAIIALAISLFLYFNRNKSKTVPLYLILYGFTRFIAEFFRYHQTAITLIFTTMLSVICVVIGICIYKACLKKDVNNYE